jgi:hypothetical protein
MAVVYTQYSFLHIHGGLLARMSIAMLFGRVVFINRIETFECFINFFFFHVNGPVSLFDEPRVSIL